MAKSPSPRTIGNRLAPARFILFVVLLLAAVPSVSLLLEDWQRGIMIGFDIAAAIFLLSCLPLLRVADAATIRAHARNNDANRVMLLAITTIVLLVVLATVAAELSGGQQTSGGAAALVVGTLLIAWLFSNIVYALHYAHLHYLGTGGIDFPKTKEPGYSDFVYFAFTLGMTFQTSDVAISDAGIRRVVTIHCFAAFVFNLGVLAFTINVLGS
jgi:uncharacterized membrane protein